MVAQEPNTMVQVDILDAGQEQRTRALAGGAVAAQGQSSEAGHGLSTGGQPPALDVDQEPESQPEEERRQPGASGAGQGLEQATRGSLTPEEVRRQPGASSAGGRDWSR
ncbi:unnamed protein product [Pleuronectes platessa]|uniref:Uncharacterized protein n=1 Tax=Pleuronectes platessa TaxID=8262 RepID=A0A9N7W0G6_PLEPL|nr:unnamed protein product [Pleuronectes platessa]